MADQNWDVQVQVPATFSFNINIDECKTADEAKIKAQKILNSTEMRVVIDNGNIADFGNFKVYPGNSQELYGSGVSADSVLFRINRINLNKD